MKENRLTVLFLIILLLISGLWGIYRGTRQGKQAPAPQLPAAATPNPPPSPQQQGPINTPPTGTPIETPAETPADTQTPPMPAPHSAEHAAALELQKVLNLPDNLRAEAMQKLTDAGTLSAEQAYALLNWRTQLPATDVAVSLKEIGTLPTGDGERRRTRYRFSAPGAENDLLVSIGLSKTGIPYVRQITATPTDQSVVDSRDDALNVVEALVDALQKGDIQAAGKLIAPDSVSDATLAGLCMMFEDGAYALRGRLPIRNMFTNDTNAGYIVYLTPQNGEQGVRQLGIELVRDPRNGWSVKAISPDDLLARYEETAVEEGGNFNPMVSDPQGGDSIVLHFGFDDATLSPRSLRQLNIVADVLNASGGDIRISGHTDDLGTEEYNRTLSARRAEAVRRALIDHGVPAERITTQAMGKSRPRRFIRPGDSSRTIRSIRSENRRAEIYLDF